MWTMHDLQIRWSAEWKMYARFGFALALMFTLGVVSYETTLRFRETEQWEDRIDTALGRLEAISMQLKDAETGERGYLITGDERYLESYHQVAQTVDQELSDIQPLIADNPGFRQKIDILAPLIAAKLDEMAKLYELGGSSQYTPAARAALINRGQQISDEILQVNDELEIEQGQLLQQRTDESDIRDQTVNLSITFGSFLAIILAAFMIGREIVERKRADEALRESAARFHRLAENALDMIYRYRLLPTPKFEYVSPAAIAITGYSPEDFYADPDLGDRLADRENQQLIEFRELPATSTAPLTVCWRHKDGVIVWTSQQRVPIYDSEGRLVAIEGIVRDVTERVQAYQMLERRVEERTHEIERRRRVAEGMRDIMTILNSNRPLDAILESIIAQACRLLGTDAGAVYQLHERQGLLCVQVAQGLDAEEAAESIPVGYSPLGQAVLKRAPIVTPDLRATFADPYDSAPCPLLQAGPLDWLSRFGAVLAVPLMVKDDIYGVIALYYRQPHAFSREETELAVALCDQAALAIENARLHTQAKRVAVAAERSRLARDLHDAVTQTLFSTNLIADVLPRLWERDPQAARRRLDELRDLTRGALAEMRALLLELRPTALAEVGIVELLRQLTEAIGSRARVPIALSVAGQCVLPPDVQVALYRIAQEALNNVARHANASQVTVALYGRADEIELRISDDGQGFDLSNVVPGHLGLGIMRERADAIGATLQITSQPSAGAQVAITWPRPAQADQEVDRPAHAWPAVLASHRGQRI